jgi:hypothetical protein
MLGVAGVALPEDALAAINATAATLSKVLFLTHHRQHRCARAILTPL